MKAWHVVIFIVPLIGLLWYYQSHPLTAKVRIRDVVITTEVAATEEQKQRGLGGRVSLGSSNGMLFPYDHKEQYNFWMRGMQFPLDFIWIDGKVVVDITENVPHSVANTPPAIIKPTVPVDKVLEVNAGFVKQHHIAIGDQVTFIDR